MKDTQIKDHSEWMWINLLLFVPCSHVIASLVLADYVNEETYNDFLRYVSLYHAFFLRCKVIKLVLTLHSLLEIVLYTPISYSRLYMCYSVKFFWENYICLMVFLDYTFSSGMCPLH